MVATGSAIARIGALLSHVFWRAAVRCGLFGRWRRSARAPSRSGAWLAARGALATVGIVAHSARGARPRSSSPSRSAARGATRSCPRWRRAPSPGAAGMMLAFGAALRAVRRDREEGVSALVRARGASAGRIRARARRGPRARARGRRRAAPRSSRAASPQPRWRGRRCPLRTRGSRRWSYALAFAATLGPVAMAALGARTRAGGYLTLLAVLVLPELLAPVDRGAAAARVARAHVDPRGARPRCGRAWRTRCRGGARGARAGGARGGRGASRSSSSRHAARAEAGARDDRLWRASRRGGRRSRREPHARWGAGVHAVVGHPPTAGRCCWRSSPAASACARARVRVLDGEPGRRAGARAGSRWSRATPALPERMRVREVLSVAAELRGEPRSDPAASVSRRSASRRSRGRPVRSLSPRRRAPWPWPRR